MNCRFLTVGIIGEVTTEGQKLEIKGYATEEEGEEEVTVTQLLYRSVALLSTILSRFFVKVFKDLCLGYTSVYYSLRQALMRAASRAYILFVGGTIPRRRYFQPMSESQTLDQRSGRLLILITGLLAQLHNNTVEQLAEMLNKQPKRDDMLDKFSEIYSHQRKTDIPLYDGIVSKEKLIEDWLREASRVARTAEWSDEVKLRMFADRLTKMALRFHEELIKKKPNLTFAEWKKEDESRFQKRCRD